MAINELIAGGIKLPQFNLPDYGADLAQMAQIQSARNQNALAQYQLGAAQRAEAKDVAFTNALMNAGTDEDAIANALLKSGKISEYSALLKAREEKKKTGLERRELENKLVDQRLKQSRAILDTFDPNDPNIGPKLKGWHAGNHADEYLGPLLKSFGATTENSIAEIDNAIAGGPAEIEKFLNRSRLAADKFAELYKPHLTNVTPGSNVINQKGEVVYTAPAPVKPVVVGDKLIDPATGKEIYAAPPVPVKPVVVGGRLVNPTTGEEIYAAPDKPVVVGSSLVDPATGKQIYQGAPAPTDLARLQAERDALIKNNPKDPLIAEYNARIKQITTHAPGTNVSVINTPTAKSLSEPVGKLAETSLAKAQGAAESMESANQIRAALNAGNVIAGPLAGARTKFAQVLEMAGVGDKEKLANTRNAIQGLASMTLASRADLKGQGQITDMETKLLERAKSADIGDLTIGELHQIVNTAQKVSNRLWSNHQTLLKTMENDPEAASARKYYAPTGSIPEALGDQTSSKPDGRKPLANIFGQKK